MIHEQCLENCKKYVHERRVKHQTQVICCGLGCRSYQTEVGEEGARHLGQVGTMEAGRACLPRRWQLPSLQVPSEVQATQLGEGGTPGVPRVLSTPSCLLTQPQCMGHLT